jgi:hypothetical protein
MKLIPEYLALTPDQRGGLDAYINVTDAHNRHHLAIVSPDFIRIIEGRQMFWRELRDPTGPVTEEHATEPAAQPVPGEDITPPPAADHEQEVYQRMVERLLHLCGYSQDTDYFDQSLRTFVEQSRLPVPEDDGDA